MIYRCTQDFTLPKYDEDYCEEIGECVVPKDSLWCEDDSNILGADIHLECIDGCDDFGWIEISNDTFDRFFVEESGQVDTEEECDYCENSGNSET